ncbi:hypothetical protein K2173_023477 [Erythroxylum novogranatense]|uniref:Zinc finger CCCH domain-containing protein 44 n=1 Tax=Erythroxylum novogranatense TaxID=1862640 RepID=A0AAV8TW70_9ROSI|nr:hypothetical protein K2173_023477 [Erythroxylum novogranatense]
MEGAKLETEQEQEHEYRPCIESSVQRPGVSVGDDQCQKLPEMDHARVFVTSQTVSDAAKGLDVVLGVKDRVAAEMSTGVKRRRGRPPRALGKTSVPPPPPLAQKRKKDEEDVCFICFDGGNLVLCDRRGCPKAYHPACIKRDEAYFQSKAKWNCGWHICSNCQKASHYLCYTCTYSLCKGCTKEADYVSVRGNKGFCGTCMSTIMLIENVAPGNKERVEVDFDDKTSWEYLFKIYWSYLKTKLSLNLNELTKAKNPWKGDQLPKVRSSWKGVGTMISKVELLGNDIKASCTDNHSRSQEASQSKRMKTDYEPKFTIEGNFRGVEKTTPLPNDTTWATKELLEFVSLMRNGDISMISQFEVQDLLLEYIKRNNLCDPCQKSHIVCDSMLMTLFGKARVGHIEMQKLLEYHFPLKGISPADDIVRAGVDVVGILDKAASNTDSYLMISNQKEHKTRKKMDESRLVTNPNPDDFAAIDVHNINLLYVKRNIMEILLDDAEKFHEKVVGSFVRIQISCDDQKHDTYRLVQVVGTSRVAESYNVGTRRTNIMLEIMNIDKKEIVSIDGISDQAFSEDECKHLHQSIKCGLTKWLKVGEIQQKASVLQAVKIHDGLEADILQLNHLRDRSNEGDKKEPRKFVERLELLNSPNEPKTRLLESPIVHANLQMNPLYESEEDAGEANGMEKGNYSRLRNSGSNKKALDVNTSLRALDVLSEVGIMEQRNLAAACDQTKNLCKKIDVDRDSNTWAREKVNDSVQIQGGEALSLNIQTFPDSQMGPTGSPTAYCSSQTVEQAEQSSDVVSAVLPSVSTAGELFTNDREIDELWQYQDSSGKIEGPFHMMQLRTWNVSGHFPADLRVWRINEKPSDSILLTDALTGKFHGQSQLPHYNFLLLQGVAAAMDDMDKKCELRLGPKSFATLVDNNSTDSSRKAAQNDPSVQCKDNNQVVRSDGYASHSSSWTTAMSVAVGGDGRAQMSVQGHDLPRGGSSFADKAQVCSSFISSSSSVKLPETSVLCLKEGNENENWCSGINLNDNSYKSGATGESDEKQADSEGHSSQSSGCNWRPTRRDDLSNRCDSNSGLVSVVNPIGRSKRNQEIGFTDLPISTTKQTHSNVKNEVPEEKPSICSNAPVLESGPGWSTNSSLVIVRAQLPEVAGEWGGYSSAPTKEWDSNLAGISSLKPTEGTTDHAATPTSGCGHLTHTSPANLAVDTTGWQSLVPESNEFSLVDESVSDLLAEVEAMESLGGMSSPTSKMRCEELTHDSDDDCFSPVGRFSPAPDPGKSDAFSSTGDMQVPSRMTATDEPLSLKLSNVPSHNTVTDECIRVSQMPSKLSGNGQPLKLSHVPHCNVISEPICASKMPSRSPLIDELHQSAKVSSHSSVTDKCLDVSQKSSKASLHDEPHPILRAGRIDSQKTCRGQSSRIAEVGRDAKLGDVLVKKWDAGIEIQPLPPSIVNQEGTVSAIQPPASCAVSQWQAGPDFNRSSFEGSANLSLGGVYQGDKNMDWGAGDRAAHQQPVNTNATNSTGNISGWGSQPWHAEDRYGGGREHRSYHQGRDSGYRRDRPSWNRQPFSGVFGNGSGPFRPPPRGQRVCKFYENGNCKKGALCSYWHPGS